MLELHEENSMNNLNLSRVRSTNKSKHGMYSSPRNDLQKSKNQKTDVQNDMLESDVVRDLYENEKQLNWQLSAQNKRLEKDLRLQESAHKKK